MECREERGGGRVRTEGQGRGQAGLWHRRGERREWRMSVTVGYISVALPVLITPDGLGRYASPRWDNLC